MARILIVDDDENSRKSIIRLLHEHQCIEAANGTEAIALIDTIDPDLIILDQRMPHMDGLMTLAQLRQIRSDTQFIMLTAEGTLQLAIESLKQGAIDFLVKPVDPVIIKHAVNKALRYVDLLHEKRHADAARRHAQEELVSYKDRLERLIQSRTQETEAAQLRAENAIRSKAEFLANISHELRTPLHSILNFSSFGVDQYTHVSKEKLHEYFSVIHESGGQLLTLVNDLLDLSKLETKKQSYAFAPVHVAHVIQDVVGEVTHLIEEKRITIAFGKPRTDIVRGDKTRLTQAIRNILSNAIRSSTNRATVTITVTQQNPYVAIAIADTGLAATPEELKNIFAMVSLNHDTKSRFTGNGLGFAIVKQIIDAHEGKISVQQNQRSGIIFTILLPQHTPDQSHISQ